MKRPRRGIFRKKEYKALGCQNNSNSFSLIFNRTPMRSLGTLVMAVKLCRRPRRQRRFSRRRTKLFMAVDRRSRHNIMSSHPLCFSIATNKFSKKRKGINLWWTGEMNHRLGLKTSIPHICKGLYPIKNTQTQVWNSGTNLKQGWRKCTPQGTTHLSKSTSSMTISSKITIILGSSLTSR